MTRRLLVWVPLGIFLLFVAAAVWRLASPGDTTLRSRLIGQPLPAFSLPPAFPNRPSVAGGIQNQARIVNVFASWCVPCIAEAPQLMAMKARGLPIDAIAIRDRPEDIARFLSDHGDPYRGIGLDNASRVQLTLGSSGVPETFVVDARGVIRHQHIGAINPQDVDAIVQAYEAAR